MAFPLHPRLMQELSRFWPSRVAIQDATATRDAHGQPDRTWDTVPGLESVPCAIAPVLAQEARRPDKTVAIITHHLTLWGHYPEIEPTMRAVVDGGVWNILGVESDSHGKMTRLKVELVE